MTLLRMFAAFFTMLLVSGCSSSDIDVATYTSSIPKFGDSDPVDFGGGSPHRFSVHGVDVSKYQGDIDWKRARANGVSFAFIKATEGGDHMDEKFYENWKAARRAGIPRGAYHFYYFCTPAAQQARWFIAKVPKDKSALPPVLDMEWNHGSPTCPGKKPRDWVLKEMRIFLKIVEAHFDRRVIIYTAPDFHEDILQGKFKKNPMWLRSVTAHPRIKYGSRNWTFWQYTGTGRAKGFDGNVDLNVFQGSRAQWKRWLKSARG